jgi:serine/threonine protein kinase
MPREGEEFAGYRIIREIGRGGMGVVFLAEERGLNRRVALKVIAPGFSEDDIFRRRFEREAQHAASLDHPNVVPIFASGTHEGQLFLAMRFVDGSDLTELLKDRGQLPADQAAGIVEQTASALDAAHAQGLIHRDVKPGNILLTGGEPGGHVYLTDFGLTKQGASESSFTNTGRWVGTVDYVAPEQIEAGTVSARTDVYGLGCVLFQTLTGRTPYGGTDAQKMWAHINNPPPSIQELGAETAELFDPIIARSLSKNPEDRFPSAGDLGRAVKAAAAGSVNTVPERSLATGVAATGIAAANGDPDEGFHERQRTRPMARTPVETAATKVRKNNPNSTRNRVLVGLAVIATLAIGTAAGVVIVAGLGKDNNTSVRVVQSPTAETTTVSQSGSTTSAGASSSAPPVTSLAPASYVPYEPSDTNYLYVAEIPTGNGWGGPVESRPTGGALLRTTIRGPESAVVVIDRTPNDVPELGGGYESSRTVSQPAFGSATEYIFSASKSIPECTGTSCVDYLIDDGQGGGWGVLAGGPDLGLATEVASRVTQSVTFGGE